MNKILIIEDDPSILDVLLAILLAEEFDAIAAENGSIGVQLASEVIPDLILCDIMMPEMDGYEVLTALRSRPATATIPFIFLTAKADRIDLRKGMELGADDYLTKPFTRDELLGSIATRLEKQGAIDKQTQKKLEVLRQSIALSLPQELLDPILNIFGFAEVLLTEYDAINSAEILEIAQQIQTSNSRLYRLIQNYFLYAELELAATEPDKFKALRSRSSISSRTVIIDAAVQKSKEHSREADLHLDVQEATVKMSKADLQKIVEETVDNAFKFSLPGTPVSVTSILEHNIFTLEVSERGRGMTKEQISSLGAYVQFERKLYEQQGSGLGLSIVKRVVEVYGGELNIDSIPNQQTNIRVILPGSA